MFCKVNICQTQICKFNEVIDSEDYVFGSELDNDVEEFRIYNLKVEFLPRGIGEKLPILDRFFAESCGLTIIRDFYFANMRRLKSLFLVDNKIAIIEPQAFRHLIEVKVLGIQRSWIERFDENLFHSMVNLESLYLDHNRIKFLSPATFEIPGAELGIVDLSENACIDRFYDSNNGDQLEPDLIAKCSQGQAIKLNKDPYGEIFSRVLLQLC